MFTNEKAKILICDLTQAQENVSDRKVEIGK